MDPSSQFTVPTIIDVPELIVTNDDIDIGDSQDISRNKSAWIERLKSTSSVLGHIIGLSNIWRFPYLCYKYQGGAFHIAYLLMLILIGYPLLLMEMAFGQYANEGPITIWRISPAFEGIGYVMCLISCFVAMYFNVVNVWIWHYVLGSITFGQMTWSTCDHEENSDKCFLKPDEPVLISEDCHANDRTRNSSTLSEFSINQTIFSHPNETIVTNVSQTIPLFNDDCSLKKININGPKTSDRMTSNGQEKIITSLNPDIVLPTNEYFHDRLLGISESPGELGQLNWSNLFLLVLSWGLVFMVLMRGLRLNTNLSIASLIIPYLMLTTLFVRGITLEGSWDGIIFYLKPRWDRFKDIDIWADATTQIFFAISPCWGGIINLASMNKFHNNFQKDTLRIIGLNYATSLFVGFISFAILGYMSNYSGIPISEVVDSGQGFIFMVFPEALTKLPFASFNSFIFFTTMLLLGFNSVITLIDTVITTIVDTWPHKLRYRRPLILMILCTTMCLIGLIMCFSNGFYVLQWMDNFAGTYIAAIIGILELIAIAWVYGVDNFQQDIDDMISLQRNFYPSKQYWYCLWRYLTPSLLFAIVLFSFTDIKSISYRDTKQPGWSITLGWTLSFIILSIVPFIAFIRFMLTPKGSYSDRMSYLFRPSEDWAPSSYVSGPKLLNRHSSLDCEQIYSNRHCTPSPYDDQDMDSNDSNEDLKVINGRANYIIPEEEDDTDFGLPGTSETNI